MSNIFQSTTFQIKIYKNYKDDDNLYLYTNENNKNFFFIWSCQMDITYLVKTRGKNKCFYEMKKKKIVWMGNNER